MPATTPNIRTIFDRALEIASEADRRAFLAEVCPSAEIRGQVEALLAAHAAAGSFLETPPTAVFSASETARAAQADDSSLSFLSPSDDPASLGRLGLYEIVDVIGRGGMGIVLRARDTKLNRVVAIKVLAPELASNPTARKRFQREAHAAAAVVHQHVVTIHAVDEDRVPYLVMECIAGQSLNDKIDREGQLQLVEILRIGQQIAAGLAAAHALGLMHRDVKPANILLENGVERVRITDFGLARAVDDASVTRTGEVSGTPQYMSPEQAQGLPMDARSDLFSFGCVLYAMCTGRPPFRAETAFATARRVCEDTPRPIREVNPEIPEWLTAIIDRLLAKKPEQRIQTAAEVADLLGQHLARLQHPASAVLAKSANHNPQSTIAKRHWILAAAAAIVLLLLGASLTEATGLTHFAPTLLRIVTGEGTLLVEVNDPAVKITVEGDGGLVISGAGLHEIRLKPGKYQLRADKHGQRVPLDQDLVTILRGKEEVVRVRLESPATARPAAAVPLDPARPFVLLSPAGAIKRQLAGLQTALSEATSGDIIEICGDGPYLTPPSSAAGKALTIRAGVGFRPVLKLDLGQVGPEAKVTLLRTTAPLVVEGIEFHVYRSGLLPPPKINAPLGQCICLQADAAPLRVANCRFLGLGNVLAIDAHYTPDLEIRNSLLLSGNNTLFAYLRGPAQVRIENNLILADIAPLRLHVDGRQPDQTTVSITRNTLLGYYAITWLVHEWDASLEAQSKSATKLSRCEVAENLCCSQVTQALFNSCFDSERPVKPQQPNPDELQQALRTLIEWNERDNGYSDHSLSSGQLVSTTDVSGKMHPLATTLDDWNAFWGLKDTGSAVGAVRFIDGDVQQLLRSSKESLLPASFLLKNDSFGYRADKNQPNLGADVSLVGPGAAYECWQATPAYDEWRRSTNQTGQARAESRRSTNQAAAATPSDPTGRAAETGAFVVLGGKATAEQKFDTLAEAVRKSSDGDTIEIRGNGPFATEPIQLSSRRTIRAGQGFRPIITFEAGPSITGSRRYLLEARAPLVLEGLEFNYDDEPNTLLDKYAIDSTGTQLYVANCRFIRCNVGVHRPLACQLRNSQCCNVRNRAVQFTEGSAVVLHNNIVATGGAVPLHLIKPEFVGRMKITRNVLTAGTAGGVSTGIQMTLRSPRSGETAARAPLQVSHNIVSVRGSILGCQHWSDAPADSPPTPLEAAELEPLPRHWIAWQEEQNLYSTGTPLLSVSQGRMMTLVKSKQPLKTLAEWNQYWGQSDTGSMQDVARFQGGDAVYSTPYTLGPDDFRLRSDSAGYRAGPGGKDLGPDIDLVGPGAAYERWKKTPDYQVWLKETGQLRAEIPKAQAGAFVILSGSGTPERKCDTLADAVLRSSAGDTIEIRGNGPFVTAPILLTSRRTIRAGQGFHPVISAYAAAFPPGPRRWLLDVQAPLVLEGLEFQGDALPISPVSINSTGAPLYVANCRITGCLLMAQKSPACQLRNSQVSAAHSFAVLFSGSDVILDNNIAASGGSAACHMSSVENVKRTQITRNVFSAGERGVWTTGIVITFPVASPEPNAGLAPLHLSHNIVSAPGSIVRAARAARATNSPAEAPPMPLPAAELEFVPRQWLAWHEEQNVYSTGTPLLSLSHFSHGRMMPPVKPGHPLATLDGWNEYWGQSDTGSIQGVARFQGGDAVSLAPHTLGPDDFRLRSDSAGYRAGPDGKDLGPDIDLVGPGAAYERWKTTPEYEVWLQETGQKNKTGR